MTPSLKLMAMLSTVRDLEEAVEERQTWMFRGYNGC